MKKIIFIFSFLCFAIVAKAQNEFYIPWSDDSLSLDGTSHIVDENGNLYILGVLSPFDTLQGNIIGTYPYSNTLVKIDKNNNIVWEKLYYNYYPGSQLLFLNNSILVPYNLDIGFTNCWQSSAGSIAKASSLNAALLINNITGDTISNAALYDSRSCGADYISYAYADSSNNIYFFYTNDSVTIGNFPWPTEYIEKADDHFNIVFDSSFPILNNTIYKDDEEITKILYDNINSNFIIAHDSGILVYNKQWDLLYKCDFTLLNDSFRFIWINSIAYNSRYYAISCSITIDSLGDDANYVIVLTKDGHLISCQPSLYFSDIVLSNDNNIFGVSSLNTTDTLNQPVTLEEMDLFGNVKRKVLLGKPGVIANKISLTSDNEIVVTGSVFFTGMVDSFPRPDVIYYYRQAINEIPLLINDNSICNAISVYPNPTKNSITISSIDFNTTYNASVELFNIFGQKLEEAAYDTKTLSFDLTDFPAGIYFLKATNNNSSCVKKVVKQ